MSGSFNFGSPNNYDLFSLNKVLHVGVSRGRKRRDTASDKKSKKDKTFEDKPIVITKIAVGGFQSHEFTAVYSSNGFVCCVNNANRCTDISICGRKWRSTC